MCDVEEEPQLNQLALLAGRDRRPKKIPVPMQYREGSKILRQIVEEGKSLKDLVYNNKHCVRMILRL